MNVISPKLGSTSVFLKLCALLLITIFTTACSPPPPTNEQIFVNPSAGTQFESDSGTVILSKLSSQTVCYTTDGAIPEYDRGNCDDGTTQSYQGGIQLSCEPGEIGTSVSKEVRIVFDWEVGTSTRLETRDALFFLNCDTTGAGTDSDGDGIPDVNDNCPSDVNVNQNDEDGDGVGDICDFDLDNDGHDDDVDNCPNIANSGQEDADTDGLGDECDSDDDNDGVDDEDDNCPLAPNSGQQDSDNDGTGDACDSITDTDGDGHADSNDNCPTVPNPGQEDEDGNGVGDACEGPNGTDKFFHDYLDLIFGIMDVMQCQFNNCDAPDGLFNWSINASDSPLDSGSVNWKATVESFWSMTAKMTLTASDATLDDCTGSGSASGILNSSATGPLNTSSPVGFICDGLSGRVAMKLRLTGGGVTGGYYDVYCNEPNCDATAVRFKIIGKDAEDELVYSREVLDTTL
ncbi:hypothetical protein A9Q99_15020 [Gammaproteobacteria bacterium 45_16_T64]|nr:hypothetical protein A9Q99_15020 [Gammaproteobacteria bacterium 45_16_T64]